MCLASRRSDAVETSGSLDILHVQQHNIERGSQQLVTFGLECITGYVRMVGCMLACRAVSSWTSLIWMSISCTLISMALMMLPLPSACPCVAVQESYAQTAVSMEAAALLHSKHSSQQLMTPSAMHATVHICTWGSQCNSCFM